MKITAKRENNDDITIRVEGLNAEITLERRELWDNGFTPNQAEAFAKLLAERLSKATTPEVDSA
jgi:hypothetical protein